MKFSQKVVAASSALMLITVAVLSYQHTQTVNKEVERLVHSSLHEMVGGVQNAVVAAVEGKKSLALTTTQVIEQAANDRSFVASVLERPELKDSFVVIGLGYDQDGHFIENLDNWQAGTGFDPRERPWYHDAKRERSLVFTEPYVDEASKEIIVSIATPVEQRGTYVGGMTFDVNLSVLTKLVNDMNLLDSGYLFITTASGRIIAHPERGMNGQMLNRSLPNISLKEGMQKFTHNGDNHLAYFSYIPEEDWYVGAIIDEDKAFSALDKMAQSTLISLIVGGLISVLALGMLLRHLLKPLGVLNRAIDDVATGEGDLTKRLSTDTDEEFAQLAQGFNHFASTLQQRIIDTKALGIAILHESEQSAAGSVRALQAMGSQLQELEQLATAMHEMAMTAQDVASNAQGAAKAAQDVEDATREGSMIVNDTAESIHSLSMRIEQAVEEVQGLESATNNIETILQVINEIADQTNLLALNAAIEAARAGESGRGFAVVADEVRTLAQRTQQSTTEIRTMIEHLQAGAGSVSTAMRDSQVTVEQTVAKAQAANVSLDRIQVAIQQISDMNMQIASAAEQQSLVAEEINGNTIKIKDLATQVAHAAEEDNQLMESQTEHVRQQDAILSRFIV